MRIVAGKFRGKQLSSPTDDSIRPTSDRARESMFNILGSRLGPVLEGKRVLDLFAGTGALGLEALSRGAAHVTFVDTGAEARGLIRDHIQAFGAAGITKLLRRDATAAIADMGFTGRQGEHMQAVFNTDDCHNLVVCTLCSCYPWPVLGLPPVWYKSLAYRARAVIEPRAVLAEFGLSLPQDTRIRVWDSTAELRYLVIPQRPEGTEGLDRDALAALVSRDCMIGTALPRAPEAAA